MNRIFFYIIFFNIQLIYSSSCNIIFTKSTNHTKYFINSLINCDTIIINEGIYFLEFDKIYLKSTAVISSKGNVEIHAIKTQKVNSKSNPSALFIAENPKNIDISNIKFYDTGNRAYAVKVTNNDFEKILVSTIQIYDNTADEIGLIWIGPKEGFSFNRSYLNDEFISWYENGPIKRNLWKSNILIKNNILNGDKKFYSGNFKKPGIGVGVSAITLLYTNNIFVESNIIYNYRFGIWAYGGASRDNNKNVIPLSSLSTNIFISKNRIFETYSPIWFSKSSNINVFNNYSSNNQDVAIDFEGCYNANIYFNNVSNSRGGALTVLNGSENISFFNNVIDMKNFNKNNNIVLIRDSNKNIKYINNKFIFYDDRVLKRNARIMLKKQKKSSESNKSIEFINNTLLGVDILNSDGSSLIINN
tara:strand:- start:4345 stop:5595 length:1251 start_codon:yes stop_codon:yes gene_type:complete